MKDKESRADTVRKIRYGLTLLEGMPQGLFIGWRAIPPAWLAPRLGLTAYKVEQLWAGVYPITDTLKVALVDALTEWKAVEPAQCIA